MDLHQTVLYYVGCLTTIAFLPRIIDCLWIFLLKSFRRKNIHANKDAYAIITGATDGIGLQYARDLAQRGYNLLLLSRTKEKLSNVKRELEIRHNIRVETLAVDFTRTDIYDVIKTKINSIEQKIAILVNNVGMTRKDILLFRFTQFDDDMNSQTLICNTYSVVRMCEIVLPIMERQNEGIIINMSSVAGDIEVPYQTMYSATKAFVTTFTNCLAEEYSRSPIIVQNVKPSFVKTSFAPNFERFGLLVIDTQRCVDSVLNGVGIRVTTDGDSKHAFCNGIIRLFKIILPHSYFMYNTRVITKVASDRLGTFKKGA